MVRSVLPHEPTGPPSFHEPLVRPVRLHPARIRTPPPAKAVTNARRWRHSRETVTQLERALISRPEIEMAKGALIAQHGCTPGEAFAKLVDQSQRRNVNLHIVAQELVASLQATSTD